MRFVFSLDMEVPYGRYMLDILLKRKLVPEMVIEEDSARASRHRDIFLKRLEGKRLPPKVALQVEKHRLPYARVPTLNGSECEEILKRESPDLMVSGGTITLMKKNIFEIPKWGTLVSHPGLLPHVRGASSPAWSIYNNIQVGCSCIIIDEGTDTGPVIKSRIVPVYYADTYEDVVERNTIYCGELMADVVSMFKEKGGPILGETQDLMIGKTFKIMPPGLIEEVKAMLASGSYRWMEAKES